MHPIARCTIILAAGFILNVVVTWANVNPPSFDRETQSPPIAGQIAPLRTERLSSTTYVEHEIFMPPAPRPPYQTDPRQHAIDLARREYPNPAVFVATPFPPGTQHAFFAAEFRGFPFRCFGISNETNYAGPGMMRLTSVWGPPSPWLWFSNSPIFPVWPGLAANSIIWSCVAFAVYWPVSLVWRSIVRRTARYRRARGLCEKCEYPRAGLEGPCPECGREPT